MRVRVRVRVRRETTPITYSYTRISPSLNVGTVLSHVCVLLASFLLLATGVDADVVRTTGGYREGEVEISKSRLLLDDRAVPWKNVVSVLTDEEVAFTSPNALVMRNGEIWRGTILGLRQNTVRIRTAPFGAVDVDLQLVACLHFNGALRTDGRPGRLYRVGGTPISGTLAGISATGVSIHSALGVFNLPRRDVSRYVSADRDPAGQAQGDELTLLNGSVYRGTLTLAGNRIALEHPLLGQAEVSRASVLHLRRHDPSWSTVSGKPWQVLSSGGPLGSPPPPAILSSRAAATGGADMTWIEAVRLEAETAVSCAGPSDAIRTFSSLVGTSSGHEGILRATAGGQRLAEMQVVPGDPIREWSFDVPAGNALHIQYRFAGEPGIPCTVVLGDPLLTRKSL